MTIEIKNNKLKIGNLSWSQSQNKQVDNFTIYFNTTNESNPDLELLSSISKDDYLNQLNNLHDEINPNQNIFEVVALISNNNSNNKEKLTLQKEMLDNRYRVHSNYEDLINENLDRDAIVESIEKTSKDYLKFYENIEDIIFNISLTENNFGNSILDYFRGNKSYKLGKVIYWSNKFLDIDYDDINYNTTSTDTDFLSNLDNKFYDFKNYINKQTDQDFFIINDLLISQTNSSRETIRQNYLDNTIEIVSQSLINLGRSMYLPVHTTSLINRDLYKDATKYHNLLNKTKDISRLSDHPIVNFDKIPDVIRKIDTTSSNDSDYNFIIHNISNKIDLASNSLDKNYNLINESLLKSNYKERLNIDYNSDSYNNVNDNYFKNFRFRNLRFQVGDRKPTRFSNNQNDYNKVRVSFIDIDSNNEFIHFTNSGSDEDRDILNTFYNIDSESSFRFSSFFKKINLNYLLSLVGNLTNSIKLENLKNKNINIDFLKEELKLLLENKLNLVFGNSLNTGLLNINNLKDNIFIDKSTKVYFNNFTKNIFVDNNKLSNTSLNINESTDLNLEYITSIKDNFDNMIENYYPNNFLKNQYEFFKKIYSDLHNKTLERHVRQDFSYAKDMLYSRLILNKNSSNLSNIFLAKTLGKILNIELNEKIFNNQDFNLSVNYEGKNSDFLNITKSFIVLNDIYEKNNSSEDKNIYSLYINLAGSFLTNSAIRLKSATPDESTLFTEEEASQIRENASLTENQIKNDILSNSYDHLIAEGVISQEFIDTEFERAFQQAQQGSNLTSGEQDALAAAIRVELVTYFASLIFNEYQNMLTQLELQETEVLERFFSSFEPDLPTNYTTTNLIPSSIDARINGIILAKYNNSDGFLNRNKIYELNDDLRESQIRPSRDFSSLFSVNLDVNQSNSPIEQVYKNETKYRDEIFLSNSSSIFNNIFNTIESIIKLTIKKDEINKLKSQDDIISFIGNNKNIAGQVNSLLKIYRELFNQMLDKVFYAAVFDYITISPTSQIPQFNNLEVISPALQTSRSSSEEINFSFDFNSIRFSDFIIKEIEKNKRISNNIFNNQNRFNNILEIDNVKEMINHPENSDDFKFVYTINDYLLVKLLNILRRSDIAKSSYFDIVYSYLDDTLKINQKNQAILDSIQDKIDNLEDVTTSLLDNKNIIDLVLSEGNLNYILKNYYENSIRHAYINEKITNAKARENISEINFTNDVLKEYHEKKYSILLANSGDRSINRDDKDVLCIAIPNLGLNNINNETIYKISIGLADHVRPDLYIHEKDYFYSPSFSSNSKIIPDLKIAGEIEFNNTSDRITFFNSDSNQLKDRISLITREELKKIVSLRLTNSNYDPDQINLIAEKMFDDYKNSGQIENILNEVSNFPIKNEIFTNEIYQSEIVNNDTISLIQNIDSQSFLSLFGENKNRFISNTNQVSENLSETIYDFEESSYNTKIYSFIKSFDQIYTNTDLRKILEEKEYYDFYFIEISPKDFVYKFTKNTDVSSFLEGNTMFEVFRRTNNDMSERIKKIETGLKRKFDGQTFSKNNYNYIIKVEEI